MAEIPLQETERQIAPDGYAVGFTEHGRATHAQPPGHYSALCGQRLEMAWNRQIDRDHLNVTCKRCIAALKALHARQHPPDLMAALEASLSAVSRG